MGESVRKQETSPCTGEALFRLPLPERFFQVRDKLPLLLF